MTARLFLLQRISAAVLALGVMLHLVTIVYAVRGGLTAGEILGRTQGNFGFLAAYSLITLAIAVHAPIGLRTVLREWAGFDGPRCDGALLLFALVLAGLGLRAVFGLFLP